MAAVAIVVVAFAIVQEEFDCSIVDLESNLADLGLPCIYLGYLMVYCHIIAIDFRISVVDEDFNAGLFFPSFHHDHLCLGHLYHLCNFLYRPCCICFLYSYRPSSDLEDHQTIILEEFFAYFRSFCFDSPYDLLVESIECSSFPTFHA